MPKKFVVVNYTPLFQASCEEFEKMEAERRRISVIDCKNCMDKINICGICLVIMNVVLLSFLAYNWL